MFQERWSEKWWSEWRRRLDAFPFEPSQVVAAVVVAVVVVVAGVGWLVSSRRAPAAAGSVEERLPMASASASASASTSVVEQVVVHVAGAVVKPGVYALGVKARVGDAVTAAGGAIADADLDRVNLAALVTDGERVYVPRRGEAEPALAGPSNGTARAAPVDLNMATVDQLDALPGVGPSTARAIVDYRTRHGRFRSVEQLLEVAGIGPAKLAALRPKVHV